MDAKFRPCNYSVHFIEDMERMPFLGAPKWIANLRWLSGMIERGEHFQLPDNGRLIDVRDMPDDIPNMLHPPYPVTVIEYSADGGSNLNDPLAYIASSRRIIVAIDGAMGGPPYPMLVSGHSGQTYENGVWITPIAYDDRGMKWMPPSSMFFLSYDRPITENASLYPQQVAKLGIEDGTLKRGLDMAVGALAYEIFSGDTGHLKTNAQFNNFLGSVLADAQAELFVFIQLCMTLACSNVATEREKAPEKLNRARLKSGKPALFDYHILTIPGAASSIGCESGARAVRSHLRRGHIRRAYGKLIWVNATIVNGNAAGFIKKSYAVGATTRSAIPFRGNAQVT